MSISEMKFSEAMLLGLPEIEFTNMTWLARKRSSDKCYGCLVGAALYAKGERLVISGEAVNLTIENAIGKFWPKLAKVRLQGVCPFCIRQGMVHVAYKFGGELVSESITHLATHYSFKDATAEEIADLIRTFEPEENEVVESTQNDSSTTSSLEEAKEKQEVERG